ncbi:33933_t:CDS:1, partial [Gigaspora margarita]
IVRIPNKMLKEFKQTMVFLIHQKLFNNFKYMGHQSFHASCSESLFFRVFQGHIHYSKANIYKCIFRGQNAYQTLAQVFNSNEWDQKFYKQNQQIYIVIQEEFYSSNKSNIYTIEESEIDIDSLLQLVAKRPQKQYHKPKFTYSEILVKWYCKRKIEEDKTVCVAGFIYMHFLLNKKEF